MYRKICLLLFFNFQSLNISMKLTLIMFIMYMMLLLIIQCQPFILADHNNLEYYSSFSSFFLIFAAYLYILEISEVVKAICFIFINVINFFFILPWNVGMLRILLLKYSEIFLKYIPNMFYFILAFDRTLKYILIKSCFNREKIKKKFKNYHSKFKNFGKTPTNKHITFKSMMASMFYSNQR